MTARSRELFGLLPVSLIVAAGFAAVLSTRSGDVSDATLTYGAVFLGLCVVVHLFIRARLPDADPYMFPISALLAAVGLVVIYRIDAELAREQAQWFVVGMLFFAGTILVLRDHHVLERYRYTIAAASIALLVMPRLPGIGAQVNGAFLAIKLGSIQFQPAEFAKLGIIIFLASYLRETGDILVRPRLRPLPAQRQLLLYGIPTALALLLVVALDLTTVEMVLLAVFVASLIAVIRERPSLKHFGPLLLVWGLAMLMLIFIRDLGSSLMFFGGFLALLYVATGRLSLVSVGATMFLGGAAFFANSVAHVHDRVETWLDTFSTKREVCPSTGEVTEFVNCQGYQIAQSLFAQADGGLFGEGFGRAMLVLADGPVAHPRTAHRPDLRGDHERGGPVRRRRADRRVPAVHLSWLQDRDAGQRRLLEAACDGPDGRARAAGLRDRGRGDEGHPADRGDAAVRVVRRQLDRRQHGAPRAAAHRVGPRARRAPAPRRAGLR